MRNYTYYDDGSRFEDFPAIQFSGDIMSFCYDALGRVSGNTYWYNSTQKLFTAYDMCRYDALGRQLISCDPQGAERIGYDGDNVDQTSSGWRFVHGPGLDDPILGRFAGFAVVYYLITDGAGRRVVTTDTAGIDKGDAGNQAGAIGAAHTYQAQRAPAANSTLSGLSFFRNRYYDQATGRWTQEDPIGPAGGINLYTYVGNNPAMYTDPFGLRPCPQIRDDVGRKLNKLEERTRDYRDAFASGTADAGHVRALDQARTEWKDVVREYSVNRCNRRDGDDGMGPSIQRGNELAGLPLRRPQHRMAGPPTLPERKRENRSRRWGRYFAPG